MIKSTMEARLMDKFFEYLPALTLCLGILLGRFERRLTLKSLANEISNECARYIEDGVVYAIIPIAHKDTCEKSNDD
jgi:hypothetical protein